MYKMDLAIADYHILLALRYSYQAALLQMLGL